MKLDRNKFKVVAKCICDVISGDLRKILLITRGQHYFLIFNDVLLTNYTL